MHIKSHRQKLSLTKQYKTIWDDLIDKSQQSNYNYNYNSREKKKKS